MVWMGLALIKATAVVAVRASDLITGSRDGSILVLKATSARSRYLACMESFLRLSQATYPRLRVEFGLIHIPGTSALGLLRILCNGPGSYSQDIATSRNCAAQNCTPPGGRDKPSTGAIPSTLAVRPLSVVFKTRLFRPAEETMLDYGCFQNEEVSHLYRNWRVR